MIPRNVDWLGLLLVTVASLVHADDAPLAADITRQFETSIRPLLATKCLKCHGPQKQEGNLRLDSRSALLAGGDSGPAVVPGKPVESLLVEALKYESFEMPPTGKLSEEEIRHVEHWIAAGALWPEHLGQVRPARDAITPQDRQWWAFQPLQKPQVPIDPQDHWSRSPIDRFVHRRMAQQALLPAPRASKTTLVRRLYFNLIGLPPTPQQIDAFVNDPSPHAWEKLIDRLLDDRRYGEHWARYWLDLVRYAESDGWNQDAHRPHIWRYRDYVVESFNEDIPYPEFVLQQLAGDEIPDGDPQHLAAAGLLRLGIYEYNQRDARSHWNDIMNEMTDVAGDVFLGMGIACARCHDHKFDPIQQQDYFKLRAFFEPIVWRDDLPAASPAQQAAYQRQWGVWQEATVEIRDRIEALLKPYHDRKWTSTVAKFPREIQACFQKPQPQRTSWENQMAYLVSRQFQEEGGGPLKSMTKQDRATYESLQKQLARFDQIKPKALPKLMTVSDFAGPISPTVIPDDPHQNPVAPGFLSVLSTQSDPTSWSRSGRSSGRRTALARWIGRSDNPLTTRVIVNRIWQQHFCRGIVPTPNDFGRMGQPPTHPELLDWLTVFFVENGWRSKPLHKLILMSAVWQQSAHHPQTVQNQAKDPLEQLYWRAPIRRLRAEQIRDAMLLASGELKTHVGGPSVEASVPCRGIYVKSFRNKIDPFLHAFDMAHGLKSVAERDTTTTPTQSLLMINGDYALGRAQKLAGRLQQSEPARPDETICRAFRLAWGRLPNADELEASLTFVGAVEGVPMAIDPERLTDLCHVLFNSNEFLYLD